MTAKPDSSSPHVAVDETDDPALLRSLVPLLIHWLPRQRWFAGKGRPLDGLSLAAATELLPCTTGSATPGLLHLLVRAHQGEEADCYQLLVGTRPVLPPLLAPALIGRPSDGPLRGLALYDAVPDPRLTALLLERLRAPGRLGGLRFRREPGSAIPSGLRPRPLLAEQSNSSVVYGDTYILKLFRRVSPGVNPDLELPLALARSGCDRVPAPVAWFEVPAADPVTLGVLQPFLPRTTDGWQLALRALERHADFSSAAHSLGRATADVHTALARSLPTCVLRGDRLAALADGMAERLEAVAAAVPQLRPYRSGLHQAFGAIHDLARSGGGCAVQRVHGDLHLGQALHGPSPHSPAPHGTAAAGGWTLIDFEGEPARPLAERRRPQPVLRDVAGMLRSFDYAAGQRGAGDASRAWAAAARAAYCAGYAEAGGIDPAGHPALLRAHETDKAVYEVLYEARNRPNWLPVPLAAVRRLAAAR
ncbi:maltokinase [Streptomyces sp. 549]|uniref:maltokinase N-terminal cap-like domain-containing protein n=1 Tax=Streptomyces sp. 549 TaxID=3049076 RepID=UPI0024C3405C|nr:maltokinase [Streptomyces sp. 549]MDK1474917.1 maltokinase [Streptomyces sp. 549]